MPNANENSNVRETEALLRQACEILTGHTASPASTNSTGSPSSSTPRTATQSSTGSNPLSTATSSILQEHRRLFNRQLRVQPYGRGKRVPNPRGRGAAPKDRTFTRTIVCLAYKDQSVAPTALEKLSLSRNGLGEKKVLFPSDVSSVVVKDVLYDAFPKLRKCGGFEMLLTKEKSRTQLRIVQLGGCSTDELKCLGTGRIYIRPMQADIPLEEKDGIHEEEEECLVCGKDVPLRDMREHMEVCQKRDDDDDDEIVIMEDQDQNSDRDDELTPAFDYNDNDATAVTQSSTKGAVQGPTQSSTEGATEDATPSNLPITAEGHISNAVEKTIKEMAQGFDPTTVLKCYQGNFLRGRKLDLEAEDIENFDVLEGRTFEIFVSRSNILEDAMSEVLTQTPDCSLPLDVTFNGECARDLGGPRREFLGAIVKAIQERLFTENEIGEGY